MKLFRLIGTMTIVAAVAATMAVSASAEVTAKYNAAAGTVEFDPVAEASTYGYTVKIMSAVEGNDVKQGDIFQLAQENSVDAIVAPTKAGKYYATIGSDPNGPEESAKFVVPQVDEAVLVAYDEVDGATDSAVAYKVITTAPTGLAPHWYATIGGNKLMDEKEAAYANIEGTIKLGLIYTGGAEIDDVKVIWE